jgi:Tol biopolymer transport system component
MLVMGAIPLLVSACAGTPNNPRIELPQQYRLPQADLVSTFEQRSGRIALIDETGNLVVMDQTGGAAVKITRAAAAQSQTQTVSQSSQLVSAYNLPIWSPDASQIAFVEATARRTSASRVIEYGADMVAVRRGERSYTVEQTEQGQAVRSEPNTTAVEQEPSRVIIERGSDSGELVSVAIYLARADGKSPLQELYISDQSAVTYLDWSPDSSHIAFLTQSEPESVALNLVDTSGAKARVLAQGVAGAWHWHPDGKTLMTKVDRAADGRMADLALVDPKTDQAVASVATKVDLPFRAPAFSPDGNSMLLTVQSDGQEYLALADGQGTLVRKLVPIKGQVSFSWSPVQAKVAYIVQELATEAATTPGESAPLGGALHVLDVNTGEDRVLSNLPVLGFFWSPDGTRLATFSPVRASEMAQDFPGVNLASSSASAVLMLQTIDVNTRAYRQLFYFEPTNAFLALLSQYDRFSRSMTLWSPDSKRLVFPVIYTNAQTSYNLILETEATGSIEPRVISEGTIAVWSPR